jgi:hypothetical protein
MPLEGVKGYKQSVPRGIGFPLHGGRCSTLAHWLQEDALRSSHPAIRLSHQMGKGDQPREFLAPIVGIDPKSSGRDARLLASLIQPPRPQSKDDVDSISCQSRAPPLNVHLPLSRPLSIDARP